MSNVDISAIVTLHNEGTIANASLTSAARAKALAERQGLRVEIIAVLDRPDEATRECVSDHRAVDMILPVTHCDPGLTRNSGIGQARGEWVALLDGDDLWCETWLASAHKFAQQDQRLLILHPEATLYFGVRQYLFVHVDMEDEDFDLINISISNYWTSLSFARRTTYSSIPFLPRDLSRQIGFEDWGWNMETISQGFIHKRVPNTAHAVRTKQSSIVQRDTAHRALPTPTTLFRHLLERPRLSRDRSTRATSLRESN